MNSLFYLTMLFLFIFIVISVFLTIYILYFSKKNNISILPTFIYFIVNILYYVNLYIDAFHMSPKILLLSTVITILFNLYFSSLMLYNYKKSNKRCYKKILYLSSFSLLTTYLPLIVFYLYNVF